MEVPIPPPHPAVPVVPVPPAATVIPAPVAPPSVVVEAPVVLAVPPVVSDPDREASRKLLVVNGITQKNGRRILLIKGRLVEVGDTVTVTYNGRRFPWRLIAIDKNQPQWE